MNFKDASFFLKSHDPNVEYVELDYIYLRETYKIRNNSKIREYFINKEKYKYHEHLLWFERYAGDKSQLMWVILFNEQVVGQFGIYNYDLIDQSVEFGRLCIKPDFQHIGLAKNSITALLNSLKSTHKIKFVVLKVLKCNVKALGLYQKIGFNIITNLSSKEVLTMSLKF